MSLEFDPYGTLSQVRVFHNSITKKGPIIATTTKSAENNHISYLSCCEVLVPSSEKIMLQDNKNSLKVYYALTKEEKGYLENLAMHNPIAKTGLLRDIKIVKVDKQPFFDNMKLSKVNVFVIEPQEIDYKNTSIIEQLENSPESYAINTCTSLSGVINQLSKNNSKNKEQKICISVKGGIAKSIYEAMRDSYIEAIDLKFEDVAACLENIVNFNIDTPIKLQNISKTSVQLKRLCSFYSTNLMYKLFISSFLHTKHFENSNWKNKLIISYILAKTDKLAVDMTNIAPDIIDIINNYKNEEEIRQIASMLMTNIHELKQTIRKTESRIDNVKITGHSAMNNKSDLVIAEFVSGNISEETEGLQQFSSIQPIQDGMQNIIEQI